MIFNLQLIKCQPGVIQVLHTAPALLSRCSRWRLQLPGGKWTDCRVTAGYLKTCKLSFGEKWKTNRNRIKTWSESDY